MKKQIKFRLVYGFGKDQFTPIKKRELAKVYTMFLKGEGRTILESGVAIRAQDIMRIEPDWNATMNWSSNYVLGGDDFVQIGKGLQEEAKQIMANKKDVAHHLIRTRQEEKAGLPTTELNKFLPEALQTKLILGSIKN